MQHLGPSSICWPTCSYKKRRTSRSFLLTLFVVNLLTSLFMLSTGLNVSTSKLANLIKTVLLSDTTHTWLVHSTVWFKSTKQCSLGYHHYKNLSTKWKTFGFSEWINGPSSASCANFICFVHLELQQESEMHPYQRTKASSSPKLYESMGILSGISQVGSSRPQNEPTGSSRSPEWKINRDQPTSRGIIPRVSPIKDDLV